MDASARLLCARRSHARGSFGSAALGGIDLPALTERGTHDAAHALAELLDVLRRHDDHVHGGAYAIETHVDGLGQPPPVWHARFDDQQVDIAIGAHLATRRGAEQYDAVGLGDFDDPADDLVEDHRQETPFSGPRSVRGDLARLLLRHRSSYATSAYRILPPPPGGSGPSGVYTGRSRPSFCQRGTKSNAGLSGRASRASMFSISFRRSTRRGRSVTDRAASRGVRPSSA